MIMLIERFAYIYIVANITPSATLHSTNTHALTNFVVYTNYVFM